MNSRNTNPYPAYMDRFQEDYIKEAHTILKVLKKTNEDEYEETLDLASEFYVNTIDWIDEGQSVDLESFFNVIVAIRKHLPDWIDGNGFRIDHEIYAEGIANKNFFLAPENEDFLLKLIALGPEADHFLCEILYELENKLNQSFIDQSLEILLKRSTLNDCQHVASWSEVSGNVIAGIIESDRLSTVQIERVIQFLEAKTENIEPWQMDTCKFQLAQNNQTPDNYLLRLTQEEQGLKFGWVKDGPDRGEWVEASISDLAQKNLRARESLH